MEIKNVNIGMFMTSILLVFHGAVNLLQFDIILKDSLQLFYHYLSLF